MMRTTKRLSFLIGTLTLVLTCSSLYAQQYPVFTQYYFNELVLNPAYAGAHVQLSLTSSYRNQWVNFPGAPKTFSFSGHSSLYNGKMGVGLLINHDEIGSYGNENVYAYYSYKLHFRDATLSMGLSAGFNFLGVDFSNLDPLDPNDPSLLIPLNEFKPNFGTGVYYNRKNFFVGLSVPFILNSELSAASAENAAAAIVEARYYFIRSGVILPITPKETVKLNPSFLVRAQEGQPLSFDLNLGVIIHDVLSTGVSWRSGDSFINFIDLKLSEKFHFAYSYDWTTSDIRKYSNGSHEFMINYRQKITSVHKELNCPTYYHYR